jgi:hypothetical protein
MIKSSFIETNKYGGLALDIYAGSFSLVAARRGQDGSIYIDWAYPQYKKKPKDTAVPVKVYLADDPAVAIKILKEMIKTIEKEGDLPVDSGVDAGVDDDIPF